MKRIIITRKAPIQEKGVQILLGAIGILIIAYLLLLVSLTFSAIEKRRALISIKTLHTELGTLERAYSSETGRLGRASLSSLGYDTHTEATFATRKSDIASYTLLYAR